MCPHWVAWKGISYLHPMKLLLLTFQPIFVNVNVRRTKVRALKVQRVRPAVSIHYRFHTQTLWAFLTVPTQALLHPHTHTHHTPPQPPNIQTVCALSSRLQLLCIWYMTQQSLDSLQRALFWPEGTHTATTKYITFKEIFVNGGPGVRWNLLLRVSQRNRW